MRPFASDPERESRPFARRVSEWSRITRELPDPPIPRGAPVRPPVICQAVHADMRTEVRRARWIAALAWFLVVAISAGAGMAIHSLTKQAAALRQERFSLTAELASQRAQVDRLTNALERQQADLDGLRRDASVGSQHSSTLQSEIQRVSAELDRTRAELKDAEQREAQARTRWAYAEGERDALFSHLNALLERIEKSLQPQETPAGPELPALDLPPDVE